MDWSALAPTALGGLLALGGGFLGQWWADRRAVDREERERAWQRHSRNFADSRATCLAFFDAFESAAQDLYKAHSEGRPPQMQLGWEKDLDRLGSRLELYADVPVIETASRASRDLLHFARLLEQPEEMDPAEALEASNLVGERQMELTDALRAELGVPAADFYAYAESYQPRRPGDRYITDLTPDEIRRLDVNGR